MASDSVLIVVCLFSVHILCSLNPASGTIEGGFGNGNWDSRGYGDDKERTAAPTKKRIEWKKSLKVKFMQAINYYGLENATPTIILKFMNEPDLSARHVASHLQKYRIFLEKLKVALDAGDEDKLERLSRSSFAHGHPELLLRDQPHLQLLNQQHTGTSIGSTIQPSAGIGSTLPLTAASSNSHGTIQFSSRSIINLPRNVENSNSYLMLLPDERNNYQTPSQQPMLGNCNGDQLFCQENRRLEGFGMQQSSNNFENGGNVENSNLPDIFMMLPSDEQDNYQPPSQQQDGGHDQLPYQVEVPDPAANQFPNPSADQVPNPGPYPFEDNAPNGTILEPGVRALFELDDNTWDQYLSLSEHIWDGGIWFWSFGFVHIRYADILDGGIWNAGTWEADPWY